MNEFAAAYSIPWRNSFGPYEQVARVDELPEVFRRLIEKYKIFFDDYWWYWLSSRGRGKGLWVHRAPLWQTQKRCPTEKYKLPPVFRGQKRLEEAQA